MRSCHDCGAPVPRTLPWCRRCFAFSVGLPAPEPGSAPHERDGRKEGSTLEDLLPILVVLLPVSVLGVLAAGWVGMELLFAVLLVAVLAGLFTVGSALL